MQESVCDHETIWNRNMLSRHKPHSRCAPHSAKGKVSKKLIQGIQGKSLTNTACTTLFAAVTALFCREIQDKQFKCAPSYIAPNKVKRGLQPSSDGTSLTLHQLATFHHPLIFATCLEVLESHLKVQFACGTEAEQPHVCDACLQHKLSKSAPKIRNALFATTTCYLSSVAKPTSLSCRDRNLISALAYMKTHQLCFSQANQKSTNAQICGNQVTPNKANAQINCCHAFNVHLRRLRCKATHTQILC